MNAFKRFFALFLTLCMVLSYVPVSAFAAETATAAPAPSGVSGATEPFPLSLMTNQGNSGGHYRIPAMVTMNDGTLVAAADARWQSWDNQDDNGNIDTVVSYSKDNGATWEVGFANYFTCSTPYAECWGSPTIIDPGIMTDGEKIYMIADLFPGQANNAGNCTSKSQNAVGYDANGRMMLRANANADATNTGYYLDGGKIYANDGTEQEGYTVDAYFNLSLNGTYVRNLFEYSTAETGGFMPIMTPHLYMTVGEFDASGSLVWSEPTMLNPIMRSASEQYYLVSPGRGIMTKDGILVIGGYGNATGGEKASIIFFDGESWHRSSREASSVSSETEIVELSDGTLRMFARHSGNGNYVQYIDWTPVYTNGKVTDYTPGTAVNTTAVAHNNTNVTAIAYSKTSGGKQVVLVSAPGDTSSTWTRLNGKLFTFLVDPDTKAMTLVNTVEVNGASDPYSYSCLTEQNDGTIALLYENGDGGNISYVEYDAEDVTGLIFDEEKNVFVDGNSNTTGVSVEVAATSGVTHIHTQSNTNVSGITGYTAYDIVLCTDAKDSCTGINCTSTYTRKANVTIPITAEMAAKELKGFVVNGDGTIDYVMDVTVNSSPDGNYTATFRAPHFSTVGVMPKTDEEVATSRKTVLLHLGEVYTEILDGIIVNGSNADTDGAAVVNASWSGEEVLVTYPTAQLGSTVDYSGDIIDLNDCLYTFTKGDDGMWTISATDKDGNAVYVYPGNTSSAGYPQRSAAYSRLTIATATGDTGCFTIMSNDMDGNGNVAYLYFDRGNCRWDRVANLDDSSWLDDVALRLYKPVYEQGTGDIKYFERVTDLANVKDGQYLIVGPGSNNNLYAAYPSTSTGNRYCQLAKVTGNTAQKATNRTTITFRGAAEGETTVLVGTTLYTVRVIADEGSKLVELQVGETKKETLAGVAVNGSQTDTYAEITWAATSGGEGILMSDSSKVALADCQYTVTVTDTTGNNVNGNASIQNSSGTTLYIDPNSRGHWNSLCALQFQFNDDGSAYIYKIQNANYLYVNRETLVWDRTSNASGDSAHCKFFFFAPVTDPAESSTEIPGYKKITSAAALTSGKYLVAFQANDNNWYVMKGTATGTANNSQTVKMQATQTEITFKGLAAGDTTVVVGYTKYNIHVTDGSAPTETVNVVLDRGQTKTYTINGHQYSTGTVADPTKVDMTVTSVAATKQTVLVKPGEIVDGKSYLIVPQKSPNPVLTYTSGTTMSFGAAPSVDSDELWTFTASGSGWLIHQGDQYLNINSSGASVRSTSMVITVAAGDTSVANSTSFYANGQYLNNAGNRNDTVDVWWDNDAGSAWYIYEIVEVPNSASTTVSFTGLQTGETTARVGHVAYNITVKDPDPVTVDVLLKVDETKSFYIEGVAYTDADVATAPSTDIADMTVFGHVPTNRLSITDSIKSGRKYLIVVNNRDSGNNATNNTLTFNASGTNMVLYNNYTQATTFWTIERAPEGGNKFYVKTPYNSYLAIESNKAYTTDTPTALDLVYADGYWTIAGNNIYLQQNGGTSGDNVTGNGTANENSRWELYELTDASHTQVEFTGKAVGTTTAKIGHVTYNITVAGDTRDVEIFVGETWKETLADVYVTGSNAGDASSTIATVTWNGSENTTTTVNTLNTDGTVSGTINLADAELTFTESDGKYVIMNANNVNLNIDGLPFNTSTNERVTVTFDENGAARLMNSAGHYLRIYFADNACSWSYRGGSQYDAASDEFKFYIYAPVADSDESSTEMPGYKKITSTTEIVSGQKYLLAFQKGNTWYVAYYNSDAADVFKDMVRVSTTVTGTETDVTIVGKAPGKTRVEVNGVIYNITVKPYYQTFVMEVDATETYRPASPVNQADIDKFNAANGAFVTAAYVDGKLVFTAIAEGVVNNYELGGIIYFFKITRNVVNTDESKYVGGQSGTEGNGQIITRLIVSNDTVYDLNMAADVTGNIRWESTDESVFTIDQNGTVTSGSKAGEAYVNVYVDGDLFQTIRVTVLETNKQDGNNREIDIYNSEVTNCDAYYTYNGQGMAAFHEGAQLYLIHSKAETDLITFYATPKQGYALSYVNGTGGSFYHNVSNQEGTAYLTDDGTHSDSHAMKDGGYKSLHDQLIAYVVNNNSSHAADLETVHKMLNQAVIMQVDGAFFFSRGVGNADIATKTTFVAEKLPEVQKEINGVLGISGLKVDWKLYNEGMYAEVGELVYFTIKVEMEAPKYFQKSGGTTVTDEYGQKAAIQYNTGTDDGPAKLIDNLPGAYFYTKDDDMVDGKYDGLLPEHLIMTEKDVKADLNRGWSAEELAAGKRVHEYYVVYKVQPSDLDKNIVNTVDLNYTYTSTYSAGYESSESSAVASMEVLGESLGDLIVDFALPVQLTGLTANQLPGINADNMKTFEQNINAAQSGCMFGTVTLTQADDDTFTLTYTPNKVLTSYDIIYIMDATNTYRNHIRVRPASTVYYEESFAVLGNAIPDATAGWTASGTATGGSQEYQETDCEDVHYPFGYDKKYADETGMSNGTELISANPNDTATFTFTGTGFDVYANCDPDSSVVAVLVYRITNSVGADGSAVYKESLVKFYQVLTYTKVGDTTATAGQAVNADGCAIVSTTDLDHGTYKVVIRHTKKNDGSDTKKFYLDGFRVYNTVADSDQYYPMDEQRVTFTELRDEILYAAGVDESSNQTYTQGDNIVSNTANGATVAFLRNTEGTTDEAMVEDWLNNGPKNEIWMKAKDNLAFTLYAGDADTQAGAVATAQLGMKAPTGYAKVTIYLYDSRNVLAGSKQYTINSATDMFYRLPETANNMVNGLTVTVVVEEGLLSVTKLKTNVYEGGVATASPLGMLDDLQVASVLDVIYGRVPAPIKNNVTRIYGDNRFETAFKVADELKSTLGVQKFDSIIVASGSDFADALSGSYLATVKNAPILLSYNDTYDQMVRDYIAENLAENGTVYILGGNAAVAETMDAELTASGVTVKRLAGANRFDTNLAILAEAGVENEEILVCTGTNFADSLSASATGKPIMLVYNEYGKLTEEQVKYLDQLNGCTFTVIGGENAVSAELMNAVGNYGDVQRLAGINRFETSVAIAQRYFSAPGAVVLASAGNYPDGLCGGVLAHAMNAPLVLTMTDYEADAQTYVNAVKAKSGVILGGSGLISDNSVVNIFNLTNSLEIIVK